MQARASLKRSWCSSAATERRRKQFLERQQQERQQRQQIARRLVASASASLPAPSDAEAEARSRRKARQKRLHFGEQLMLPEWMNDIPNDLADNWLVMARPDGYRVLVISHNGTTVSRRIDGGLLHCFDSALPNGSKQTRERDAYCILDCVFSPHDSCYYVLDMMCWKGYELYNSTYDFRLYWISTKLGETSISSLSSFNQYRFMPLDCLRCTRDNLLNAYSAPLYYKRDGLIFYNRFALYSSGVCPLVLMWKDAHCSTFFIDSADNTSSSSDNVGGSLPLQTIALVARDGKFCTHDGVALGDVPPNFYESTGLEPDRVLRFTIESVDLRDDVAAVHQLQYVGPCSASKLYAHSWSKIKFQYCARTGQSVPFQSILEQRQPQLSTTIQ